MAQDPTILPVALRKTKLFAVFPVIFLLVILLHTERLVGARARRPLRGPTRHDTPIARSTQHPDPATHISYCLPHSHATRQGAACLLQPSLERHRRPFPR